MDKNTEIAKHELYENIALLSTILFLLASVAFSLMAASGLGAVWGVAFVWSALFTVGSFLIWYMCGKSLEEIESNDGKA